MAYVNRELNFSTLTNKIKYDVDEYVYYKNNPYFAEAYVNYFIDKLLENEVVPDILIEVFNELQQERDEDTFRLVSEQYLKQKYMIPRLDFQRPENKVRTFRSLYLAPTKQKNIKIDKDHTAFKLSKNNRLFDDTRKHSDVAKEIINEVKPLDYVLEIKPSILVDIADNIIYDTLKTNLLPSIIEDIIDNKRYKYTDSKYSVNKSSDTVSLNSYYSNYSVENAKRLIRSSEKNGSRNYKNDLLFNDKFLNENAASFGNLNYKNRSIKSVKLRKIY